MNGYSTHLPEESPVHVLYACHQYLAEVKPRCFHVGRFATLDEKAQRLKMPLDSLVKTIYFMRKHDPHKQLYGAMVPASSKVNSLSLASTLALAREFPAHMAPGSCGPFIAHDDAIRGRVVGDVVQPYVHQVQYDLPSGILEFAVPGKQEYSLQIECDVLVSLLDRKYPGVFIRSPDIRLQSR